MKKSFANCVSKPAEPVKIWVENGQIVGDPVIWCTWATQVHSNCCNSQGGAVVVFRDDVKRDAYYSE
jgi:hypothetical protein